MWNVTLDESQAWIKISRRNINNLRYADDTTLMILILRKIEDKRKRGWQRIRWLESITDSNNMNFSKVWLIYRTEKPGMLQFMESLRVGHNNNNNHSNGIKWRQTIEPLNEGKRWELKSYKPGPTLKILRSWHPFPTLYGKSKGKECKQWTILFSWAPKSLWTVTEARNEDTCFLERKKWQT